MRYKTIPTRSWRGPQIDGGWIAPTYFFAEDDGEAEYVAQGRGESVLLLRVSEDGQTRPLGIIGDTGLQKPRRRR